MSVSTIKPLKRIKILSIIMYLAFSYLNLFSQDYALLVNGGNIYISGNSNPNAIQSTYISGDFLNKSVGSSDGEIELDGGTIYLTGNWFNDANNNVFTNFSGNRQDGFTTNPF